MPADYHGGDDGIGLNDASILSPVDEHAATVDLEEETLRNHRFSAIEIHRLPFGPRTELTRAVAALNAYDAIRVGNESSAHTSGLGTSE